MDLGRYIKTEEEIEIMREGGKILFDILSEIKSMIKPNIDSMDLENKFIGLCEKHNVHPSCKGYAPGGLPPFPTGLCLSINNESVHCFPKKGKIIKEGDLVNVDTVIKHRNLHVDSAFAVCVGKCSDNKINLLKASEESLEKSIKKIKNNLKIGVISNTIEKTSNKYGFSVLKDYAGHGIGYDMHEYPQIPCYGRKSDGPKLKSGMTICIESLLCEGNDTIQPTSSWETKMRDSKNFCQFEHTVLVTKKGYEVLTKN